MEAGSGPHVLVVEDNDDIREGLSTLLNGVGYRVSEARTAEEGLRHLRQRPFQLIVTDYMLPGRDGRWLLEEARRTGLLGEAGALMVTAHPQALVPAWARLMLKPVELDDFLRTVAELLTAARPALARRAHQAL